MGESSEAIAAPGAATGQLTRAARSLSNWGTIGALCESSRWLAHRLRDAVCPTALPIVELGAGYGSVTRVLPTSSISLERDAKRFAYLKRTFPTRAIFDGCAIPFLGALSEPTVVVSSIPSVNNPEFARLRAAVARAHAAGMIPELVTYSYFPQNPFADIFPKSRIVALELRNIPPAFVWKYSA